MMGNFDYNATYYKVTNNPEDMYYKGRIYFTNLDNIDEFYGYGCYVQEIKVPEGEPVIKEGLIFAAHQLHFGARWNLWEFIIAKFVMEEGSSALVRKYSSYFAKWFVPNNFDFEEDLWSLAVHCLNHFDNWFDQMEFNFENWSWILADYCSDHFDRYFDPSTFNFEKWLRALAVHCVVHFDEWFDPSTFNFEKWSWALAAHCSCHVDKWKEFVK